MDSADVSAPYPNTGGSKPRPLRDPLTFEIIGAAQKVHRSLGCGFIEATHQAALAKELSLRGLSANLQREFEVFYEGMLCGTYRPDMIVGNVVVELKAVNQLAAPYIAQTISYLKASGLPTGLLLNFGSPSLQVKRFRNDQLPSV